MDEMVNFKRSALLGEVSGQPLCQDYKAAWRKCGNDKEMLIRLALSQQSIPFMSHACYEKLGLSKEYIMENFGEYINGKKTFDDVEGANGYTYQMYAGYEDDFDIVSDVTTMMWTESSVMVRRTKCPTLYISNNSCISLFCEGFNSIRVYLFDGSSLSIEDADETCNIVVYKYSNTAKVDESDFSRGSVHIFNKQLKL